jgi:uncharacterized membrane protein
MKLKKQIKIGINMLVGILILMPLFGAFSVSYPYTSERPLIISPGETQDIDMQLQSTSTKEDAKIKVEILTSGDIASLDRLEYDLKAGEVKTLKIHINIPEGTAEGKEYSVGMRFIDITPSESQGTIIFQQSDEFSFKVLVQTQASEIPIAEKPSNMIWWILIIMVIIAIVVMAYFYLKQKSKNSKK